MPMFTDVTPFWRMSAAKCPGQPKSVDGYSHAVGLATSCDSWRLGARCPVVDKQGKTIDFLLTAERDIAAAKRFFDKAN